MDTLPSEEQVRHYSVVASVPVYLEESLREVFNFYWNAKRVAWTMVLLPDTSGRDRWVTIDHFSTLKFGSMPDSGMAFLDSFINELMKEWLELCGCMDTHVRLCVSLTAQLASNRERPKANDTLHLASKSPQSKWGIKGSHQTFVNRRNYLELASSPIV
jgi:hypothetical protein